MDEILRDKLLTVLEREYANEGKEYINGIILLAPTDELIQNIYMLLKIGIQSQNKQF